MEQAKRNVENNYLFVGLVEDYDATLKILEHLAPDLFKDLLAEYRKPKQGKIKYHSFCTKYFRPISPR